MLGDYDWKSFHFIFIVVVFSAAIEVSLCQEDNDQCPDGVIRHERPGADPPFVCECTDPTTMGPTCEVASTANVINTCYGIECREDSFSSPNYPNLYIPRDDITYFVFIPGATRITLTFDPLFDVEEFKDELYVGPGLQYVIPIGSALDTDAELFFEGTISNLPSVSIEGDSFWLHFLTDRNIERAGWRISWREEPIDTENEEENGSNISESESEESESNEEGSSQASSGSSSEKESGSYSSKDSSESKSASEGSEGSESASKEKSGPKQKKKGKGKKGSQEEK